MTCCLFVFSRSWFQAFLNTEPIHLDGEQRMHLRFVCVSCILHTTSPKLKVDAVHALQFTVCMTITNTACWPTTALLLLFGARSSVPLLPYYNTMQCKPHSRIQCLMTCLYIYMLYDCNVQEDRTLILFIFFFLTYYIQIHSAG